MVDVLFSLFDERASMLGSIGVNIGLFQFVFLLRYLLRCPPLCMPCPVETASTSAGEAAVACVSIGV